MTYSPYNDGVFQGFGGGGADGYIYLFVTTSGIDKRMCILLGKVEKPNR